MASKKVKSKTKKPKRWFFKRKRFWCVIFFLFFLAGGIVFVGLDSYAAKYRERAATYDLDAINDLEIPSIIYDREGKEIGRVFVQNRSLMSIDNISTLFIDALRAGEDSRFLDHKGVDYIGVARAVKLNWEAGRTTQGASTITQQLARNAYPLKQEAVARGESSIERKLVEMYLASRIEERYSKQEILEFYLNRIYFGSGFYGLRTAALGYFGKEPKELNLVECATIVGLIRNPSNNSPRNNKAASMRARNQVIERMGAEGMLTSAEVSEAQAKPIELNPKPIQRGTSHLYERIADQVAIALGKDGLAEGGYSIHTTISLEVQRAGEAALLNSLRLAEGNPLYRGQKYSEFRKGNDELEPEYLQGALFMFDHETGEVLAHVGGRDYTEVPFDFIELGRSPMGTAFFPFIYAAALEGSYHPLSRLEDQPMDNRSVMVGGREGILGEWGKEVMNPIYEGDVPLKKAFIDAKIAATVRLGNEIGVDRVLATAKKFGLPLVDAKPLPRVNVGWEQASLKELTRAFSPFAKAGKSAPEHFIYLSKIKNRHGKVVYRNQIKQSVSKHVVNRETAWQVHAMMVEGMDRGSASGLKQLLDEPTFQGAGKGGTTSDFSDTWFVGYNGRVSCGVWTGTLQGGREIYPGAFSRDLAMPIWSAAMKAAQSVAGERAIVRPSSLKAIDICRVSRQRHTQFCQEIVQDPVTGAVRTASTRVTEYFQKQHLDSLPFCAVHSGILGSSGRDMLPVADVDAIPIQPQQLALLGDDPYNTQMVGEVKATSISQRKRDASVLDSFELQGVEETFKLERPHRLKIGMD